MLSFLETALNPQSLSVIETFLIYGFCVRIKEDENKTLILYKRYFISEIISEKYSGKCLKAFIKIRVLCSGFRL